MTATLATGNANTAVIGDWLVAALIGELRLEWQAIDNPEEHYTNALQEDLHLAWCPMAMGNRSAFWLQRESSISNPYHGQSMLTCGSMHTSASPGEVLDSGTFPVAPSSHSGHPH